MIAVINSVAIIFLPWIDTIDINETRLSERLKESLASLKKTER